ncbi:hypothetical protein [Edaphobacter acidisoli]|nr:hypothetical protein [Edaphobacter acidisoli]
MKTAMLTGALLLAGVKYAWAQDTIPLLPPGADIPRMVSPSIDKPGEPFSYASRPTDQIGVMHATAGTEITPEGFLYTGYGELMFYVGIDRTPISARVRTLEDGHLPIVHYTVAHDGLEYRFTVFAASLGTEQMGGQVVNFIRVTIHNPGTNERHGFLTTAWRYQGEQTTPFSSGDNRFRRPVKGDHPGAYQQPGDAFRPNAVYTTEGDAMLQDDRAIYFFPQQPKPQFRPALNDYYNHIAQLNTKMTATPTTPVATAEYEVAVPAGAEKVLDFKMPLEPVAKAGSEFDAVERASFDDRRAKVREFWNGIIAQGIDIETPEDKVNQTFKTSLVNDLMSLNKVGDDYVQTINQLHYHGFYLRDSTDFVRMYDTSGYTKIAGHVVDFFATKQQVDGNFLSQPGQYDGWGQALWTYGEHYRMTHDKAFAEEVYPRVVRAVDWLQGAIALDPMHLVPATDVRDNEFVPGHLTGYNFLALDGLQAAVLLAHDLNHPQDEARFRRLESELHASFMKRLDEVTATTGGYIPPTLNGGTEGTDWGNLLALTPEQQLSPFDPKVTATLRATQAHYQEGLITYHQPDQGVYLHHYLTIKNTLTELIRGEQDQAIREMYAVLLHTSSTNAGFEYSIRPWGDRDFSGNLAPHGWMAVEYRNMLRNMMVREDGDTLHLLSAVSPEWVGAGKTISVERAATYFGTVGFRLESTTDTTAVLRLSIDRSGQHAPGKVVMHLPWFVNRETAHATANGRTLPVTAGAIVIPVGVEQVNLRWQRLPLPKDYPASYTDAVKQYKQEYLRRYEALTGWDGQKN